MAQDNFYKATKDIFSVLSLYGTMGMIAHFLFLIIKDYCDTPTMKRPTQRFGGSPQIYKRNSGEAIISYSELAKKTHTDRRTIEKTISFLCRCGFLETIKKQPVTLRVSTNYLHILHPLSNENGVTCTQNVQVKDENGVTCTQNVQANNLTCTQNVQVGCTQNVQVGCTQNVQVQYNKNEYNKTENNKNNRDNARESQNLEILLRIEQDRHSEMAKNYAITSKEWKMFLDLRRDSNYIQKLAAQYNQPIIKIQFEVERWFGELSLSQVMHPNQERFLQHFLVWLKDDIKTIDDNIFFLKERQ